MDVDSPELSKRQASQFTRLNLATAVFVVAWLAIACYAIAYLISHGGGSP